jgi:hypothetical protein
VHSRIVLAVAAWLVGAGAATGGSLLAVSVLGQGLNPAAGAQLSIEGVNRALAKEAAEGTAAMPRRSVSPPAVPATPRSSAARHSAPPPPPGTTGGTLLTSQGGTLVAGCARARAYLVSWSPQPGFGSSGVVRGPAANAQVTFTNGQLTVTMVVSCTAGVPTATSTAVSAWGGTANTWGGGDGE